MSIGRNIILKKRRSNWRLKNARLSFNDDRERIFRPMKIAVTGGAGFIGSHLTRAYLDAGHDVFVIDTLINGSREALDSRARFFQLDIRDAKLQTLLQMERPDLLSHHAAQREYVLPGEKSLADADVHVRGLLNVLDSCASAS